MRNSIILYQTYELLLIATRREEVCGIRAKFPTKIPVSILSQL